jgi:SAM-dependent methyltransferase
MGDNNEPRIADLGAGDGLIATELRAHFPKSDIVCVEVYPPYVKATRDRGFMVVESDLNSALKLEECAFDLVLSNQVIEHLYDTDLFLRESRRLLKPGGALIVSTENAASWHNIGALLLGWQPFSLSNVSDIRGGIGNPMGLHRSDPGPPFPMQHHRLFSLRGLSELVAVHGFRVLQTAGAGYYPLPPSVGGFEPSHAHFITVTGVKTC